MKLALALLLSFLAMPAFGCAWDRNTLYEEEQGVEDIRDVIVGNFIRNPPRYYEMRLERVSKILKTDADNLDLYDDASVACDRLHRFDEAIAWQEKKLDALKRLNYDGSKHEQPNHSYRHLANIGTHYIHRWLFSEDKWADLSDAKLARDFVKAAITENPNAHFGREIYQLLTIEWLLRSQSEPRENSDDIYLIQDDPVAREFIDEDPSAATEGFAGMMKLGAGWASVDLHAVLAYALSRDKQRTNVAYLAVARVMDLYGSGAVHLVGGKQFESKNDNDFEERDLARHFRIGWMPTKRRKTLGHYQAYKFAVYDWHESRVSYMNAQFDQGLHPDTHSDFWDGFSEDPRKTTLPSSEPPFFEKINNWWNNYAVVFVILGVLSSPFILIAALVLILRRRKRKKAALQAA